MGTGKPGRYLNTVGRRRRSVSEFAIVHSNEGKLVRTMNRVNGKVHFTMRLASGGHGQSGMDLLDKYHIAYHITKTYPNGVRVGYVDHHKDPAKKSGIGQSWFPRSWTEKTIRRAGSHVASLKKNRHLKNGEIGFGMYKGVRVGFMRTNGQIATVFPDRIQPNGRK